MHFIYSLLFGILCAYLKLGNGPSIILLLFWIFLFNLKDVVFKRNLITGVPSAFQLYKAKQKIENKNHWLKYIQIAMLIDGSISIIAYFITKFFI